MTTNQFEILVFVSLFSGLISGVLQYFNKEESTRSWRCIHVLLACVLVLWWNPVGYYRLFASKRLAPFFSFDKHLTLSTLYTCLLYIVDWCFSYSVYPHQLAPRIWTLWSGYALEMVKYPNYNSWLVHKSFKRTSKTGPLYLPKIVRSTCVERVKEIKRAFKVITHLLRHTNHCDSTWLWIEYLWLLVSLPGHVKTNHVDSVLSSCFKHGAIVWSKSFDVWEPRALVLTVFRYYRTW